MEIILRKSVQVDYYSVRLGIYKEEKRPEILPLLQAIVEANRERTDPETYLHAKHFPELPRTFVLNILEELRILGYYNESRLTSFGEETLRTKEVLIPYEGAYEIAVANDPLVEQVILSYNPLIPDLREALNYKEGEKEKAVDIPTYIKETVNIRIKTFERETHTISIRNVSQRGTLKDRKGKLFLTLAYNKQGWELKGQFEDHRSTLNIPSYLDHETLLNNLLVTLSPDADLVHGRIPISPKGLLMTELSTFRKSFTLKNYNDRELGTFEEVKLQEIPIYPATDNDAQMWAEKLFVENLADFLTSENLEMYWVRLYEKFPLLANFNISIPDVDDLRKVVPFASHQYWLLTAGFDMKLEEALLE